MSNPFPHLLSPITLDGVTLRNRCLMGSMHTGLEETGDWSRVAGFYAARARGGAGLIVTGGMAPNRQGAVFPGAAGLFTAQDIAHHRRVTDAVHAEGGHIAMQILHAGRYAFGADCVAPSAIRSPISPHAPTALDQAGIAAQIDAIATAAARAIEAGYDGVEVMGSEGYFLNQFLVTRTNRRSDGWGGTYENRMRLPVQVVARVRAAIGARAILIYRISLIDLIPDGSSWDEVVQLAQAVQQAGASVLNTGVGWHEARVPTIAAMVPRAGFADLTARLRPLVGIPVIASNRINTPQVAETLLADGMADMVSLARPWLADADFIAKAARGRAQDIAPCIACNQACLDHTFTGRLASCLVNPRACHETLLPQGLAALPLRVAVVGAGPAGMMAAIEAAARGHRVTLFDRAALPGGQLRLARRVPGKEEFQTLLDWFATRLRHPEIRLRLGAQVSARDLAGFDRVIVATGTRPRDPGIPVDPGAPVLGYAEALQGAPVGRRVAIIGAGGIGFDVATALVGAGTGAPPDLAQWRRDWGVAAPWQHRGGLVPDGPAPQKSPREVHLLQRKPERPGRDLGKTTGWIHRSHLALHGVRMLGGVQYDRITADGLILRQGADAAPVLLPVDSVVLCAGQVPETGLSENLTRLGIAHHRIGGADQATGLDARRAIDQALRLVAGF